MSGRWEFIWDFNLVSETLLYNFENFILFCYGWLLFWYAFLAISIFYNFSERRKTIFGLKIVKNENQTAMQKKFTVIYFLFRRDGFRVFAGKNYFRKDNR